MLTGKCKEDFENWYIDYDQEEENEPTYYCKDFYKIPLSMQYGVYVDFFDSVGIIIILGTGWSGYLFNYRLSIHGMEDEFDNEIETRQEARIKAIEKANEIYNQNKK